MAQALIQSQRNGDLSTVVDGRSRNDLIIGDKVYLKSIGAEANTYSWNLLYKPEGSVAKITGNPTSASPNFFEIDKEGAYLVRLVVNAGIAGEDTQFVRLRALTEFGDLHLVAAGERKTHEETIPSDIDLSGWTNDFNRNLLTLLGFVKPLVSSGRVVFVDANDGTDKYGDYSSIQEAIDYANGESPTESEPYAILIRAGVYEGDIVLKPHVHLVGVSGDTSIEDRRVVIKGHITTDTPDVGDQVFLTNLYVNGVVATTEPLINKSGKGVLRLVRCHAMQSASSQGQGATLHIDEGEVWLDHSKITANDGGLDDQFALSQSGASVLKAYRSDFIGASALNLNPNRLPADTVTAFFRSCEFTSTGGVNSYAVLSNSQAQFDHCLLDVHLGKAVGVNPTGGSLITGDIILIFRWCFLPTEIFWNIEDTDGRNEVQIGAIQWKGVQESGIIGNPPYAVKITALIGADSIYYDGTSDNVQDALDEVYNLQSTIGTNLGSGEEIFKQKVGQTFEFKTVVGDESLAVTSNASEVQLSFTGSVNSIFQDNTAISIIDNGVDMGNIIINVDGIDYWMFDSNGAFLPQNTGVQDIGSQSNRVRSIFVDAVSSVHFVHDDGANQFDFPLNVDVTDTDKPELLFNNVPIATPFVEKFFEVKGTEIGWYNNVKLLASPLKYAEGKVGIPVLLIEDTTMAGTSITNDKGQAIALKNVEISFSVGSSGGSVDDTVLSEIVVDVYAGQEEASFSVTGYSFDTIETVELPLDIPNISSEENIRIEIFFIRNPNSSIEIPVLPLGVKFGYVLQ